MKMWCRRTAGSCSAHVAPTGEQQATSAWAGLSTIRVVGVACLRPAQLGEVEPLAPDGGLAVAFALLGLWRPEQLDEAEPLAPDDGLAVAFALLGLECDEALRAAFLRGAIQFEAGPADGVLFHPRFDARAALSERLPYQRHALEHHVERLGRRSTAGDHIHTLESVSQHEPLHHRLRCAALPKQPIDPQLTFKVSLGGKAGLLRRAHL